MVTKRDEYEEEEDSEPEQKGFSISLSTIIVGTLFLILAQVFLYLLSVKTNTTFGVVGVITGLIMGIVIMLFFAWVEFMMRFNKHLGAVVGAIGIGAAIYGLTRKYHGTYTTTFAIIAAVLGFGYIIFQLMKIKQN